MSVVVQYVKILKNGERFPLQLSQGTTVRVITPPSKITVDTGELIIKEMFYSPNIRYIKCSDSLCCVVESDKLTVIDTEYKSFFHTISQQPIDNDIIEVFCTDKKVFGLKKDSICLLNNGVFKEMEKITPGFIWNNQYNNILVLGYDDNMRIFYLDEVVGGKIRSTIETVYGRRFTKYQGLTQNVSGNSFIFYNNNNGKGILNTTKFPFKLQDIIQNTNFGVAERDSLTFYRPMDFALIAKFDCDLVNEDSELFMTNAGIVVKTDDKVYLMNKK